MGIQLEDNALITSFSHNVDTLIVESRYNIVI